MVYHYFGKLYNHFQHDRTIQRFVKNRWDFILTESMEAAYMLTPKYCIDGFYIDNDKLEIIEHIRKIVEVLAPNSAEKVDDEFAKFINMISNLSQNKKEMIYQMDPKAYWNAFGKSQFPTLYICANYVYDMVASSAAAERVWSSFGFIHTKLRNRLSSNRVDKLISIYVNNALISKLDNFEDIFNDFAFYDEDNI
ncbi:hypothetical protein PVAND_016670 [Polypedilum vanderplanki]|uniref:HAT C-terminal dimerisation domain-containing protein n=1 Tax=Polypedilum vanderplanki TaxID=319348 RepID=A0A9J6BGM6_POLVA|nr:hypothetical protein PVAND_016670 [Polypedilum vanderplanki]